MQVTTYLPAINDSNFHKICEIYQFFPTKDLNDIVTETCKKQFHFAAESTTINYLSVDSPTGCFCCALVVYPCDLSENKPNYLFIQGGKTGKQINFMKEIAANFKTIWKSLEQHPLPCKKYLLLGGILHIYVDNNTEEISIFLEIRNPPNPA